MKKIFGVSAILAMSLGLFACEKESSIQETDLLYGDDTSIEFEDYVGNG